MYRLCNDEGEFKRFDPSQGESEFLPSFESYELNALSLLLCREDVFADVHNLDHCIKYLNQSLVALGFPSGLSLYSSDPV